MLAHCASGHEACSVLSVNVECAASWTGLFIWDTCCPGLVQVVLTEQYCTRYCIGAVVVSVLFLFMNGLHTGHATSFNFE